MKITVLYYSKTGNTKKVAEIIAAGIEEAGDVEAKCMSIEDVDADFLNESKALLIGTPTYIADFTWHIKKWFDELHFKLNGKLGGAFATERYIGGGAEVALLSLIGHMLVKGMVVYSVGKAEGQPITHYGPVCIQDGDSMQQERAKIFGRRFASKALELFE